MLVNETAADVDADGPKGTALQLAAKKYWTEGLGFVRSLLVAKADANGGGAAAANERGVKRTPLQPVEARALAS